MQIYFRVDASLQIGTGHVMRCLTLASMLKDKGANVRFICRKHNGNLIEKIRSSGFSVFNLDYKDSCDLDKKLEHSSWLGSTQKQDAMECADILKKTKVDWLIVDHYSLDEDWQKNLRQYTKKLMVIDDLADRNYDCDVLLDQTLGRKKKDYLKLTSKKCKLLLGSQYALLRPEFALWREFSLKRRIQSNFKQLLINMGGVDINNITSKILKEMQFSKLPKNLKIVIIIGDSSPHLENIKVNLNSLPYNSEVIVNIENMAEIMSNSDLSIGASGSTSWERCCLGLPTLQIVTAKNQIKIAKELEEAGASWSLNNIKDLNDKLNLMVNKLHEMSFLAKDVVDGYGAMRISEKIYENSYSK